MPEKFRPPIKMPDVLPKDLEALKAELLKLGGKLPPKPNPLDLIKAKKVYKKPRK